LTVIDVSLLAVYCASFERWLAAAEALDRDRAGDPATHGLLVKRARRGTQPFAVDYAPGGRGHAADRRRIRALSRGPGADPRQPIRHAAGR
jgi:phage terminase small subunit